MSAVRRSKRRSPSSKEESELQPRRTRSQTVWYECPVCLTERLTKNDIVFAFSCGHHVCSECELKLVQRNDLRCPTCRAVRQGHTESEAEAASTYRAHSDAHSDTDIVSLDQLLASGGNGQLNAMVVMNIGPSSILDFEQGQRLASEIGPFEFTGRIRRRQPVSGEELMLEDDPDHPLHAVRGFLNSAFNQLSTVSPSEFRQQLNGVIRSAVERRIEN